jgi:MFS family permease
VATLSRRSAAGLQTSLGRTFVSLGVRDFRYLWIGGFATQIGMWIQQVAQGWLAYDLTGSAAFLAVIGLSRAAPSMLFTLPAGVLADRWDRRHMMMASQFLGMLNASALAWLVATGLIQPWHLLATSLVGAITMSFNMPARQALVPQLAGEEAVANAVALNSIAFNTSRVLGPALAGALIGIWGIASCFMVQAAGFVWALVWTALISANGAPSWDRNRRESIWSSLVDGLRYVKSSPVISGLLVIAAVPILLGMSYMQLMPVMARDVLAVGASGMGLLMSTLGIGSVVGSFFSASMSEYPRKGLVLVGAGVVLGAGLITFALAPTVPAAIGALLVLGIAQALIMALNQTLLNLAVVDEYRGRVLSVYMMTWNLSPVVFMPLGALTDFTGPRFTLAIAGFLTAMSILAIGARVPAVREFGRVH